MSYPGVPRSPVLWRQCLSLSFFVFLRRPLAYLSLLGLRQHFPWDFVKSGNIFESRHSRDQCCPKDQIAGVMCAKLNKNPLDQCGNSREERPLARSWLSSLLCSSFPVLLPAASEPSLPLLKSSSDIHLICSPLCQCYRWD